MFQNKSWGTVTPRLSIPSRIACATELGAALLGCAIIVELLPPIRTSNCDMPSAVAEATRDIKEAEEAH